MSVRPRIARGRMWEAHGRKVPAGLANRLHSASWVQFHRRWTILLPAVPCTSPCYLLRADNIG